MIFQGATYLLADPPGGLRRVPWPQRPRLLKAAAQFDLARNAPVLKAANAGAGMTPQARGKGG